MEDTAGMAGQRGPSNDWPRLQRLAEAQGSLTQDLALDEASGEPAGRGLSHVGFDRSGHRAHIDAQPRGGAMLLEAQQRGVSRGALMHLARGRVRVRVRVRMHLCRATARVRVMR